MNYLLTNKIFRQSLAISIIVGLVLIQLPSMRQNSVQAFMPTNARAFLLTSRTSNWTHQSMTRSAIKELDTEFFTINKLTNSMKKAIEQIADSDASRNQLWECRSECDFRKEPRARLRYPESRCRRFRSFNRT